MTVKDFTSLQKRIERFFSSQKFSREEVRFLVDDLSRSGSVVVFGGMIRDLALFGNKIFSSDVDLVVNFNDRNKLVEIVSKYNYTVNAFGGYRIFLKKWRVDVWNLRDTWAFKEKYVELNDFKSLLSTTFFNWDAIIYRFDNREIYCDDRYLDELNKRYLDINLEKNPNELGTFVRTLKFVYYYNACVSKQMLNYIFNKFKNYAIEEICQYQIRNGRSKLLSEENLFFIRDEIFRHYESNSNGSFTLPERQAQLKF